MLWLERKCKSIGSTKKSGSQVLSIIHDQKSHSRVVI